MVMTQSLAYFYKNIFCRVSLEINNGQMVIVKMVKLFAVKMTPK